MTTLWYGCLAGFLLGAASGIIVDRREMKTEALGHGAAHYEQVTGEFLWGAPR